MLHSNAVRVVDVRVYELAWRLRIEASAALALVQAEGEYVTSHLSQVAQPVANRIIDHPPVPTRPEHRETEFDVDLPTIGQSGIRLPRTIGLPRSKRRRRGPARVTRKLPSHHWEECWRHPPPCECHYLDEVTTRDAAEIFRVKPATIRQWVHKGYLEPTGRLGASNTFSIEDLQRAVKDIDARGKRPGIPAAQQRGKFIRTGRLPTRYDERLLTIPESAALLGLSPSTIRSWIHRGILTPAENSRPRAVQIRQGDLIAAAQRSGNSRLRRT